MDLLKRLCIYMLIILFFISVYKDLTTERENLNNTNVNDESNFVVTPFQVVRRQVLEGETVLSIIEEINNNIYSTKEMEEIINDFKTANPNVNPYMLEQDKFYYFPVYEP